MLINQLDLYNPLRAELFQEEYGSVFHIPYAGLSSPVKFVYFR